MGLVMRRTSLAAITGRLFVGANGKDLALTPLEKQVVALVLAGYTSKESGQRIGVSQRSVRRRLRGIIAKLGVANQLELVLFALHHHLIDSAQISSHVSEIRISQDHPCQAGWSTSRRTTKEFGKRVRRPQAGYGRGFTKEMPQPSA
jgi:DNA-binding CsgD family transcriptional regulator